MPSVDTPMMAVPTSKPFSISFGSSKIKSSPVTAPKKRPHSALAEPESDHEEESNGPQLVSAFDQSGAVVSNNTQQGKAPLVIRAEKNRDWREESRKKRRKNILPAEVQAAQKPGQNGESVAAHSERDEISKVSGIQFVNQDRDGDTLMSELEAAQEGTPEEASKPKTADEEAIEALLGGEKKSTLQIPIVGQDERNGDDASDADYSEYANEDERFRADVASRPDVATLEDYNAIPVEEFGAAYLRGNGWKEGGVVGKRNYGLPAPKEPKIKERRPALLGIGAKETPGGVGDELGAWGKAVKGKRKTDLTYNPVLLQNSKTGEKLTEEELQKKKKKEGQMNGAKEDDWRDRRDRNLRIDQERKTERRDKERLAIEDGRNGERSRDSRRSDDSRRRDRSPDAERRRHRSRSREHRRDRNYDYERKRRERSLDGGDSRHSSSSRRRSKSRERSKYHGSSRRDKSHSPEYRHRRY